MINNLKVIGNPFKIVQLNVLKKKHTNFVLIDNQVLTNKQYNTLLLFLP